MADGRIMDLDREISDFSNGDFIVADGPSGTAKMAKDNLLRVTAENAATSDPVLSAIVNIYVDKGSVSVGFLNAHSYITGLKAGWVYTAKASGTVTDHSSDWDGALTAGEQVVWNGSVWKKYFSESIFARKTDLEEKVDVKIGANLCDPLKVIDGVYNGSAYNTSSSYKTSDYIPVNASNITAKYYTTSSVFSSITVFDTSKQFIRAIKSSGSYTYTSGDAFIRVSWVKASSDINYISYGDEATTKEYSPIGGYVEGKFLQVGQAVLEDVENGVFVQMQNQSDLSASQTKTIISPTEFTITNKGKGAWLNMPDLPFDGSKYHVSFTAENQTAGTYPNSKCTIYVANGTNTATSGQYAKLADFQDGTFDFVFEPQYYAAHMGWDKIRVWLRYDDGNGVDDKVWDFKNWTIYKRNGEMQTDIISGNNAKELFESTDNNLAQLKSAVDQFSFTLKDPNGLEDVENGVFVQMQNQSDLSASQTKTIISPTEFTITNKGKGAWLNMPDLPFDGSKYHVSFTAENQTAGTYPNSKCTIYVANGTNTATSGQYAKLADFQDGTFDFVFEPQYYAAHMGWDKIRVWLRYDDGNGVDDKVWDFKNWTIYKRNGEMQTDIISGNNAKELFESTDNNLAQLKSAVDQFSFTLKDPNGNAYELAIDSNGTIVKFPIVPTKAHFFGNSLLTSNGSTTGTYGRFGMNATDHNLDYASRFETCVLSLNPSYVYERDANSGFEDLVTDDPATVLPLIQTNYLDKLDGDEDFVCVQLGDNGNAQAVAVLGANVETLLRAIRTKCASARVVVFGMWYSSTEKQTALFNAATNTGCKYISMSGIRRSETESYYGAVINEGYTGNWTVDDVVSVTENTATNITVVFTAGGSNHTATIDVDSYSQAGTTLSYTGQQKITVNGGVASHPGNEGFRLLANRLLYELGIVSTDEYFQQ